MGDEKIEEKCICQLCNCGMHHCPHMDSIPSIHSADSNAMNGSEYSEMYETKNVAARTKAFHPEENNLKPEFEYPMTISTHADDFKAWQVQKPTIFKPNAINMSSTGEFSAETTSRSEFTTKKPSRVKSIKPSSTAIVHQVEPFTASSTQKSDFSEKKAQRTKSFKPVSSYERNYDPLNALSVSKADYIPLELNKTKILKPKSRQHSSNAPFEGNTEQRSNFNTKRVEMVHACRPSTQYRLTSGPAETDTTYSLGYKALQGGRQQSFKPPQVRSAPEGDFDGITTTKAEFIQKRNKICPAEYVLSRRDKNFRIRSGADGHRFYTRITNEEE